MLSASLEQVVLREFEDLDTSFSLKCAILWRYGEIEALVRLECRPEDYDTPARYFKSVAALALVKKLKCLPIKVDRVAAAKAKWREGEVSCYKTNQRLYAYLPGVNLERDDRIAQHVAGVQEVVIELIGRRPPPDRERIVTVRSRFHPPIQRAVREDGCVTGRFGPGATFANRGARTSVPDKITTDPTITSECVWFLPQFFGTAWGSAVAASGRDLSFVRGNRFATAPKTALTDRSIAVEPSINGFFQLAYGRLLRARLKQRHGWDLDTAQSVHRRLACEASRTREFATLDLSNASDTVARNLVKLLLPRDWYECLSFLRSPCTRGVYSPESWVILEKFSSMGNGYTFELETVLFAAIAIYCVRQAGGAGVLGHDVFVFGDDIIVPDGVVKDLTAMLSWFGFTVNSEKSFVGDSPFRESCGADFYQGVDVRPSYLKDEPSNVKDSIGVCNRIGTNSRKAAKMASPMGNRAWHRAIRNVPIQYRLFGPEGLGDNVIWTDYFSFWRMRWRDSIRYVLALVPGDAQYVSFKHFKPQVVLACALYGTGNIGTPERGVVPVHEGVQTRGDIKTYRVGWMAYS